MGTIQKNKKLNSNDIKLKQEISEVHSIMEFEEILFAISEKIINYREEKNISQQELANILKVNQSMVSKLESGDYNPTFKQIHNISIKLTNSSNLFIDILENIKEKIKKISTLEYHSEFKTEKIIKNYSFNSKEGTNIINLTYNDYVGGNAFYEGCTSSISNVG